MARAKQELATIWRIPDELWVEIEPVIVAKDPPKDKGRKRVDARLVLDTLIHRMRSGCQWNHLPGELADDSSAHRTLQRWNELGVFDAIWARLVESCAELGAVNWEWQAADAALSKARLGGIKSERTPLTAAKPV